MKLKKITLISLLLIATLQSKSQTLNNAQLKDSITTILKKSNIPSAFVTVVSKDSILFKYEFGHSNITQNKNVDENNTFALGSISKTFTALAIMKLIKEGKLDLEDELKVVAPKVKFHNKWEEIHPIKIKHLLTHRSGFDDIHISSIIKERSTELTALDEVLIYENSYNSNWKPGLVFSYSNPGYSILGYIIEEVSGLTYQQYITKNILFPLQMNNTNYFSTNTTSSLVTGFQRSNDGIKPSKTPKLIGESAGGIVSNGNDMSKLLQLFLDEKKQDSLGIITQKQATAMEQLHSDFEISNNINSGYSLGMYDRKFGDKKIEFKGHNGSIDGFSSDYIFSKQLNIGIAISSSLMQKSNSQIINLLVNNFANTSKIDKKNSNQEAIEVSKFKEWEGTYKMLNGTNELFNFLNAPLRTIQIKIEGDSLYAKRFLDDNEIYFHNENNSFTGLKDDYATLFLSNSDNDKYLVYNEDTFIKISPIPYYISLLLLIIGLFSGISISLISITQLLIFPFKKSIKNITKSKPCCTIEYLN